MLGQGTFMFYFLLYVRVSWFIIKIYYTLCNRAPTIIAEKATLQVVFYVRSALIIVDKKKQLNQEFKKA